MAVFYGRPCCPAPSAASYKFGQTDVNEWPTQRCRVEDSRIL